MNRLLASIVMLILASAPAVGQLPYFRHFGVEQGLSNNKIICTLQDSYGFLWAGTADGLNRYDGYHFKIYRNTPGDPHSVGDNNITSLKEGKNGLLLVGTANGGLFSFDHTTERFRAIATQLPGAVVRVSIDSSGNAWFIAARQLFNWNASTGQLRSFTKSQVPHPSATCVAADGSIWIATVSGRLYKYQPGKETFISYDLFNHSPKASSNRIIALFATSENTLLAGTANQGVKSFDITTGMYQDLLSHNEEKSELFVRDFVQSAPHEYWIATETGIYIYNTQTNKFQHLRKGFTNPNSLSDNAVYTLCKDQEGGIWAGTNFGGLNYFPKQYTPFQRYFPGSNQYSLSGYLIHDICGDQQGNLWIGTEDAGLSKLNQATGAITYFQPTGDKASISYSNIHGLLAVGNELWVGTFEHGLDVLDIASGKVKRHYIAGSGKNDLPSNFVVTLYQTRSGEILIGTWQGLYRYRRNTDDFELFGNITSQVQSIYETAEGVFWICTLGNGVFYHNPRTGKTGRFLFQKNNPNSLASNTVHGQYHDKKGHIYFTTEMGISRLDISTKTFQHFTTKEGLPSNVTYRIEEDFRGMLWISTTKGLACLDPSSNVIQRYTTENGLLSDHFNFNSSFKDSSGRLYFGSLRGMVSFHPKEFLPDRFTPPLFFTNVQVNSGKEGNGNAFSFPAGKLLADNPTLQLRHNQSTLSIDFAALSFNTPLSTKYRYKLEGLESGWTLLNTNRRIYYSSLPPGSYKLLVQVLPESGSGVLAQKALFITILPPWWASPLAYALYFLLTVGSCFLLIRTYHIRTREKQKRKLELMALKKEKELYEAKMNFFTHAAHEIRTPLTLIKAPLERVLQKTQNLPEIRNSLRIMVRNTDRLLELSSQLLDFRKVEAHGFQLQYTRTDITFILTDSYLRVKALADQKNINCALFLPKESVIAMADAEALEKIFSNLLSNAVKYAAHQVTIRLEQALESGCFVVWFENDGSLIPADMQEQIFEPFFRLPEAARISGSGVGLPLARSLSELHGGTLDLIADPEKNIFQLKLPITPLHSKPSPKEIALPVV